jgi:cytochrome c biogenesis protein
VRNIRSFFLSRKTVIAVMLFAFLATLVGGIVPQRIATSAADLAKWRAAHPGVASWAETFGFYHVFSTPWFALILLLALVSLSLSTVEQFKTACCKSFAPSSPGAADQPPIHVTAETLCRVLGDSGYRHLGKDNLLRFVKHPWGYWGNFLLHCGILVTVAMSLVVALTQQRGVLNLVEGEVHTPHDPWTQTERGLLAGPFVLPQSVRLKQFFLAHSPAQTVERVASDLSFLDGTASEERRMVEINSILSFQGMHIYQSNDYGDAFGIEIIEPSGVIHREILLLVSPAKVEEASYGDFRFPWLPMLLSAKYYADVDRKTLESSNPLLSLRLLDGKNELARLSLKIGESGTLGPYAVRLVGVKKWSGLIFVRVPGMPLIFFGFLIIILGVALNYMTSPREITAQQVPEGFRLSWRAVRFSEFYEDEYSELIQKLDRERLS